MKVFVNHNLGCLAGSKLCLTDFHQAVKSSDGKFPKTRTDLYTRDARIMS